MLKKFFVNFHDKIVNIFSNSYFYGLACVWKFFVLYIIGNSYVHDSFVVSSSVIVDMNDIFYTRLGHIKQNRIIQLAKQSLLGETSNRNFLVWTSW